MAGSSWNVRGVWMMSGWIVWESSEDNLGILCILLFLLICDDFSMGCVFECFMRKI